MSIFFNLGSLILGILSWIMPIIALKNYKNGHSIANYTILSFSSCAVALNITVNHLCKNENK